MSPDPQLTDDEHTGSDHELDLDDVTLRWNDNFRKSPLATSGCPPAAAHVEPSGRDTPASVDSIPLEWDHDYDLETERGGGSQDRDLDFLHGAAAISGQPQGMLGNKKKHPNTA